MLSALYFRSFSRQSSQKHERNKLFTQKPKKNKKKNKDKSYRNGRSMGWKFSLSDEGGKKNTID